MANLKVNNYHNLKFRINYDEYWDFFVCKDYVYSLYPYEDGTYMYDKCLISYIDSLNESCIVDDGKEIQSVEDYVWDGCTNSGKTLTNISYCGVDNGLFTFRKDRISNKDFVKIFQNNTYDIISGDCRLKLHQVSGNTLQYEYPMSIDDEGIKLNGGFYQGFFKTKCGEYEVLPSSFKSGDNIHLEFVLKREDFEKESDKTLNDKYPENKGIFFYIGTRAENKWIYEYDKKDVDSLEECFQLGMDDFVEDGEIDKKDYIIGNFYDVNPDFDGYDPFELGDYTNYYYYDEESYADDYCDWKDMSDYLDVDYRPNPKIMDEDAPHSVVGWCCDCGSVASDSPREAFFNPCTCKISYRKKKTNTSDSCGVNGCDAFGDDYISDFDGVDDLDVARTYLEDELDISDFDYLSDNGFSMKEANWYYFYTDNKFMMFDRTCSGYTVSNWIEGTQIMYCGRKSKFKGNLFILMNRTCTGYTVHNIDKLREEDADYYNPYNDIYDNALAFRITDDGKIGYRLLTYDCNKEGRDKSSILEGYSSENIVPYGEWCVINVRICFVLGKMKLMFYVNGKLKYVSKELPMIRLRALDDLYEKQEGVPFNISLGGGTQGLAETIQRNYMLNPTRVYPLEQNFAGTFIGHLLSFKMYDCRMEYALINNNFKWELRR